jgi:uncharacterized protein
MQNLILSNIFIYPIKSLGGISVDSSFAGDRGIKYDRRYLLVDKYGTFLTQRDFPQMAQLKLTFLDNSFQVSNLKNNKIIIVPLEPDLSEKIEVQIWDDRCSAIKMSNELNQWFSDALEINCSLVYMPDDEKRIVEKKNITEDHLVSFADAYPYLIIGQASLDDLNTRLQIPVPMNRFRTNFVFTGGNPYEEDNWKDFKIGDAIFSAVKPCARCVITTTDQQTGIRNDEPLKTLSTYRKIDNKVMFGMNVICKKVATISLNDHITLF